MTCVSTPHPRIALGSDRNVPSVEPRLRGQAVHLMIIQGGIPRGNTGLGRRHDLGPTPRFAGDGDPWVASTNLWTIDQMHPFA